MKDLSDLMNELATHCEHEGVLAILIVARSAPNGDLDIEGDSNVRDFKTLAAMLQRLQSMPSVVAAVTTLTAQSAAKRS